MIDLPLPGQPVASAPPIVRFASLPRRAQSVLVDSFVMMLAMLPAMFVVLILMVIIAAASGTSSFSASIDVAPTSTASELLLAAAMFPLIFSPVVLYPVISLLRSRSKSAERQGQTAGKRVARTRVVMADGSAVTSSAVWRREIARTGPWLASLFVGPAVDALLGTPPVATWVFFSCAALFMIADLIVAPAFDDATRSLHDRFAGTVVVDASAPVVAGSTFVSGPRVPAALAVTLAVISGLGLLVPIGAAVAQRSDASDANSSSYSAGSSDGGGTADASNGDTSSSVAGDYYNEPLTSAQAQRTAKQSGRMMLTCLRAKQSIDACDEPAELGFTDGEAITVDKVEVDTSWYGRTTIHASGGREFVFTTTDDGDAYGVRYDANTDRMALKCASISGSCTPAGDAFANDPDNVAEVARK